ncbi:MAG: cation:proton antiporter, partial [Candidatus Competibacteraceae bacterium]|nr:cation:proton antiporter [Candidatus Competibacteraceae bacterium]
MEYAIAFQLMVVLALGTLLVALCLGLGLSPILGYLATGVLIGPSMLGWLSDGPTTHLLAELGVVLLMFTIGLEFSLPRLLAAKRLVLGLGGAQVTLSALLFGSAAWGLGLSSTTALVLGGALAMSSTAIVLKQLGEQMELPAAHGRVATGILLFQDVAAVLLLVALPILAVDQSQLTGTLTLALGKAVLVFAALVLVGRYLLPPFLHWVATTRSLELFMLTTLLLALSAAGVATLAGLSATLGAFMAGTLLGETLFRHQIEEDIRPFRDLMLGLFFITIGMQFDPQTFIGSPVMVLSILGTLVIGKAVVMVPLIRAFGQRTVTAWRGALCLAQGGEFGLLLIANALALGLLERTVAQPVLGGLILSMVMAPLLVRCNGPLARLLTVTSRTEVPADVEAHITKASRHLADHVIVCGYGRVGQNLVQVLDEEGIAVLALDLDPERVRQAATAGQKVFYGNVARPGVLRAAGVRRARAVAVTLDDSRLAVGVVGHLRAAGLTLPVLVRSVHGRDEEALIAAGAEIFPEGLESSLAFAGQVLLMLGVSPDRVEAHLNRIRAENYASLRFFFHDTGESRQAARDYPRQMRTMIIDEGYYAAGRTVQELRLSEQGVEVLDVRRGPIRIPGSLLNTPLRPGDMLLLKGSRESLERAAACLS